MSKRTEEIDAALEMLEAVQYGKANVVEDNKKNLGIGGKKPGEPDQSEGVLHSYVAEVPFDTYVPPETLQNILEEAYTQALNDVPLGALFRDANSYRSTSGGTPEARDLIEARYPRIIISRMAPEKSHVTFYAPSKEALTSLVTQMADILESQKQQGAGRAQG